MSLLINLRGMFQDTVQNQLSQPSHNARSDDQINYDDAVIFDDLMSEGGSNTEGEQINDQTNGGPIRQGLDRLLRKTRDVARAPETEQLIESIRNFIESPALTTFIESDALALVARDPSPENIIALLKSDAFKALANSSELQDLRNAQIQLVDLVLGDEQPLNLRNIVRSDETKQLIQEKYDFLVSDELSALFASEAYRDYVESPSPENLLALIESDAFVALEQSDAYASLRDAQMDFVDLLLDGNESIPTHSTTA